MGTLIVIFWLQVFAVFLYFVLLLLHLILKRVHLKMEEDDDSALGKALSRVLLASAYIKNGLFWSAFIQLIMGNYLENSIAIALHLSSFLADDGETRGASLSYGVMMSNIHAFGFAIFTILAPLYVVFYLMWKLRNARLMTPEELKEKLL